MTDLFAKVIVRVLLSHVSVMLAYVPIIIMVSIATSISWVALAAFRSWPLYSTCVNIAFALKTGLNPRVEAARLCTACKCTRPSSDQNSGRWLFVDKCSTFVTTIHNAGFVVATVCTRHYCTRQLLTRSYYLPTGSAYLRMHLFWYRDIAMGAARMLT